MKPPDDALLARARVGDDRVHFIHADLFSWTPDARYDVVFFGFWLSLVAAASRRAAACSSPTTPTARPKS